MPKQRAKINKAAYAAIARKVAAKYSQALSAGVDAVEGDVTATKPNVYAIENALRSTGGKTIVGKVTSVRGVSIPVESEDHLRDIYRVGTEIKKAWEQR